MRLTLSVCLMTFALCAAEAQMLKIPESFEKLAAKADEVVDVTLDANTLGLASRFLSDRSPDEAKAKKVVSGLKGIYVRSYKFAKDGEYSDADVEALRSQLRGPNWSCIVNVRSPKRRENAQVCFLQAAGGNFGGLAVVATEARELTVVTIQGTINPDQLRDLEGQFGIPKLDLDTKKKQQDE